MAKYITLPRLRSLQESLGYLNDFRGIAEDVLIGESLMDYDVAKTEQLEELAKINRRRAELIEEILK